MLRIQYTAIKEKERPFRVVSADNFKKELSALPAGRYTITVEKKRNKKSTAQLGYLFAAVYPFVLRGLNDAGWEDITNLDQVDAKCKEMFAKNEIVNKQTGEIMVIPELKRDMTSTEFMTYIQAIQEWSREYLNIEIPEPETQIKMK